MSDRDNNEEAPWTEEQWEQFLRQADVQTARCCELMETLFDDPNRDEIIMREMGLEKRETDPEEEENIEHIGYDIGDGIEDVLQRMVGEQDPGAMLPESVLGNVSDDEFFDISDRQLYRLPAYYLATLLSRRIDALLVPYMKGREDEYDYDVVEAYLQIKSVTSEIAGGHAMGYHDHVIGGNVVHCKRALSAADSCRAALNALLERKLFTPEQIDPLLEELKAVRQALEDRIAELRARMWWQNR